MAGTAEIVAGGGAPWWPVAVISTPAPICVSAGRRQSCGARSSPTERVQLGDAERRFRGPVRRSIEATIQPRPGRAAYVAVTDPTGHGIVPSQMASPRSAPSSAANPNVARVRTTSWTRDPGVN